MARYHVDKMADNVYLLRVDDNTTKYFEALWEIPEGITYNAYLVLGDEKNVLIDGWKVNYAKHLLDAISQIVEPRDIDYIVVNHMEPDHTGTLPALHSTAEKSVILGHPMARRMASSFYEITERIKPVKDLEEVDIGGGEKLVFHHTPWLHWPETMMTLLEPTGILFSCDAFGGYSIPRELYDNTDDVVESYLPYVRKYIYTVIGNYIQHITKNLEKLGKRRVAPKLVAPGHGLVFRRNPQRIIDYYASLAKGATTPRKVTVIYDSMYGFVEEQVSEALKHLEGHGAAPRIYKIVDTEHPHLADIIGDVADSEAIVIGASTYEAGVFPFIDYVASLIAHKVKHPKKVLILSSYGWGGIAGKKLSKTLEAAGHKVVATIEVNGRPSQSDRERIGEAVKVLLDESS